MSLDIRDYVIEAHKNAERQEVVKTMMSGEIDPELYATYLYNQLHCYSELERRNAIEILGVSSEITRFKGLGEISPNEFKHFIGREMRLDPVIIGKESAIEDILKYYMGKNTAERQQFIIDNLRIENNIKDD